MDNNLYVIYPALFFEMFYNVFPLTVFLDPPRNLTVLSSGKEGQLNVSWLPPLLKYMDDSMIYEVRYAVEGSNMGKVLHFMRPLALLEWAVVFCFLFKLTGELSFEGGGHKGQHDAGFAWLTVRHQIQGVGPCQTRWCYLQRLLECMDRACACSHTAQWYMLFNASWKYNQCMKHFKPNTWFIALFSIRIVSTQLYRNSWC